MLLPGIEALAQDGGHDGPEYGFAWRWATELARRHRCACTPAATRDEGVVIFDASGPCDVESLYAQALELALRRRGLRTLTLALGLDPARSARALHAIEPRAIVLAGRRADLDALGRLVFAARRDRRRRVAIFDFRGALPDSGASTVDAAGREAARRASTSSSPRSTAASCGPPSRPGSTARRPRGPAASQSPRSIAS